MKYGLTYYTLLHSHTSKIIKTAMRNRVFFKLFNELLLLEI